jgi:hypothetical protein
MLWSRATTTYKIVYTVLENRVFENGSFRVSPKPPPGEKMR